MFTNLFMHLLTIVGMVLLIAIATVIIVLIGSFTYVIVKHVARSAHQTMNPPILKKEEKKDAQQS